MTKNKNKDMRINYTNREFASIREDLMQIAERFYPSTFQDFSEASFGSMMIDAVAYVGDQLNFYLDYNVNESFLDTSYSLQNIARHGRILGYKNPGRPSTYGEVALYIEVPASSHGLGPDSDYIPVLKRGSRFNSGQGLSYLLTENIDFSDPKNPVVVSQVSDDTGSPTYYAIKSYGKVVSGKFNQQSFNVGPYEKYKKIKLKGGENISEIISVVDTDGNKYFEVENMSQDLIYQEIPNNNYKNDNVPSVLKPMLVSRKFVVVRTNGEIFLQFGSGEDSPNNIIAEPQAVALDIFGKDYVTDTTFDPTRLSKNTNYGIVPTDTKLSVTFRMTNPINSNASVNSINKVSLPLFDFKNQERISNSVTAAVISSLEVTNETPITGDVTYPSPEEYKQRIFDTFPTQNRAVTQADYENVAYRMPAKFGSIKRCSTQKDPDSLKRNLNMYVISEDSFGKLIKTNATIKSNLKTWLNQYRMVNDTIDILDPYIINLGIEFSVATLPNANADSVIANSTALLKQRFSNTFFIGEHFDITEIYSALKEIREVLDVLHVKVVNKVGIKYSNVQFSVNKNLSPSGTKLMCPKNAIFEIKFPEVDIKGKTK